MKVKRMLLLILSLSLVVGVAQMAAAQVAPAAPTAPAVAPSPVPPVVAKVNGQDITRDALLARLLAYHGDFVLDDMISETLLVSEATQRGIKVTEEEVLVREAKIREELGVKDPDNFANYLLSKRLTPAAFRDKARLQLVVERTFDKDVTVEESMIQSYYEENRKTLYYKPPRARLRFIRFASEGEAQAALAKIKAGADFVAVAKESVTDTRLTLQAGETITVAPGGFPPGMKELETRIFSAPIGVATGPIKTDQGYFVIRVEERLPEEQISYDVAAPTIRASLKQEMILNQKWPVWLSDARRTAPIERFITLPGHLLSQPGTPAGGGPTPPATGAPAPPAPSPPSTAPAAGAGG